MKTATKHWWLQRVSAFLLIPLSHFLGKFLQLSFNANYFEITEWLAMPFNRISLIAWVLVVCYHSAIGLQIVFEDYVSSSQKQFAAIWITYAIFAGLALSASVLLLQG